MKKFKFWGGLLALFLSGVLTGSLGTWIIAERHGLRILEGPRPPFHRVIAKRLNRELNLGSDQRERIEQILCRSHLEMLELRKRHKPEIDEILARSITALKAELSPPQQEKFDVFVNREKAFRAEREKAFLGEISSGNDPCRRGSDDRP